MVIAPIVTRSLAFGEQRALVVQQAAQIWHWPDGQERPVHPRTVLRWVAAYRAGGLEALKPQPMPSRLRRISPGVLERAVALRAEDPRRSARMIIQMLEWAGEIHPSDLPHSTLTLRGATSRHAAGRSLFARAPGVSPSAPASVQGVAVLPDGTRWAQQLPGVVGRP